MAHEIPSLYKIFSILLRTISFSATMLKCKGSTQTQTSETHLKGAYNPYDD